MGQMPTFNADGWTPTPLVSPDGRTYTPGDHAEHRQLIASGYRPAPTEALAPEAPTAAAAALAADPDVALARDAQLAREASAPAPATDTGVGTAVGDAAETTKTKTSRRNGGAQ